MRVVRESDAALLDARTVAGGPEAGTPARARLRRAGAPARPAAVAGAVLLLAVVGVAVPLLLADGYGALGIPRSDDWSYLRTLFHWAETGELNFNDWVSMTLLGQLVLARPIVEWQGDDVAAVQGLTVALGFAGLLALLWLGVTATRRFGRAAFVAVLVAVGPLWAALSVSFMTDIPAFAASMGTLALGARAIARERVSAPHLYGAIALGFLGFAIREYATVPLVAIAIVAGVRLYREERAGRFRVFVAALVTAAAAVLVLLAFWRTIPDPKAFAPHLPDGHSVRATLYKGTGLLRLLGVLVAPAVVLAGPVRIVRRSWAAAPDTTLFATLGTGAVLAFTGWNGPNIAFAGNYVVPDGILARSVSVGPRPEIFPAGVFDALIVIGTLGATMLAVALVPWLTALPDRVRRREIVWDHPVGALLGLTFFGYALAYFLAVASGLPLYDRYVLPVVPLAALLVLRDAPVPAPGDARAVRHRAAFGGVALAALGAVGFVFALDSASFDGTRWAVATAAHDAGWGVRQIRGGFEWINYHAGDATPRELRHTPYCVNVVVHPSRERLDQPGRVVARAEHESPLTGAVTIAAMRTNTPCVPEQAQQVP